MIEKAALNEALSKICRTKNLWLCCLVIISSSPNILSGINVFSYAFLTKPSSYSCYIPELEKLAWSSSQIKNITSPGKELEKCYYYAWNFSNFINKSFEEAQNYVSSHEIKPDVEPCVKRKFEDYNSVVSEWDLVCDKLYLRSHIQVALAIGKFSGALVLGVISDKYGRRTGFIWASICYMISAVLSLYIVSYNYFLFVRFLIGFAGAGCYITGFTLISEITMERTRNWICSLCIIVFPFGYTMTSIIAYFIPYWRTLQIVITLPALLLTINCWFFPESPQWLLSVGKIKEAWNVLYNIDKLTTYPNAPLSSEMTSENEKLAWYKQLKLAVEQFSVMFSTGMLFHRTIVCYILSYAIALSYFGIVLNAENFGINLYTYMALNGVFEICGFIISMPLLKYLGRRTLTYSSYFLSGILLLSIPLVDRESKWSILIMVIFSRLLTGLAYVTSVVYISELFPTIIRNTAIGTCTTICYAGMVTTPYLTDILGAYKWYLPSTIIGSFLIFSVLISITLPETKNKPLYNTVQEMKQ